jgi:HD-GYP domain-containing protein (c-di-GMP phosphodiesterase class II)
MVRMNDMIREQDNNSGGQEPVSFRSLATVAVPAPVAYTGPDWYRLAEEALGRLASSGRHANPFQTEGLARVAMMEEFTKIATGLVDALQQSDHFLAKAIAGKKGSPVISNMVNVAILATKLGMGIGYQREALVGLALAGLLHDVGMLQLPESLLSNPGKLSEEEREQVQQHPEMGFQMLSKLGAQYAWLAQVAWQEHERWNGQGYPRGLKGDQIHEYARIIGLVDIFDALVTPRPYRRRLLPHEAIRELLIAEKTAFPNQIIKALIQQFSLFPLGTMVQLNTGEVGVVTQLNARYPLRPVVSVNQGASGPGAGVAKSVDLSATTLVHIVEVVGAETGESASER